jgi:hypothetical protein
MIIDFMKIDGRQLDRIAQEAILLMAVERVREGGSPSDVIASYAMNRTTIHKWLACANSKGARLRKLKANKGYRAATQTAASAITTGSTPRHSRRAASSDLRSVSSMRRHNTSTLA